MLAPRVRTDRSSSLPRPGRSGGVGTSSPPPGRGVHCGSSHDPAVAGPCPRAPRCCQGRHVVSCEQTPKGRFHGGDQPAGGHDVVRVPDRDAQRAGDLANGHQVVQNGCSRVWHGNGLCMKDRRIARGWSRDSFTRPRGGVPRGRLLPWRTPCHSGFRVRLLHIRCTPEAATVIP